LLKYIDRRAQLPCADVGQRNVIDVVLSPLKSPAIAGLFFDYYSTDGPRSGNCICDDQSMTIPEPPYSMTI